MTARPIFSRGAIGSVREQAGHAELACVGLESRALHQVRVGPLAGSAPQGEAGTIYRLPGPPSQVADGTFAAGSRVAETRSNRLRGGTAGIFYTRRDSQPPALNKSGEGERSSEPPSGGLPPSQHLGYPDGGGLTSMCESRQLPTPRAPVRTLPPIFSLLRCCETAPTGRGARIFLP